MYQIHFKRENDKNIIAYHITINKRYFRKGKLYD
jgi:hypothetical protein